MRIQVTKGHFKFSKTSSKYNGELNSAEIPVLYCKLGQFQKIREIKVGHLYQGLDQGTKGFFMFDPILDCSMQYT